MYSGGGLLREPWLTVAEVSETLGVDPETVRRWARSGELAGVILSTKTGWRFAESAVIDFARARTAKAGAARALSSRGRGDAEPSPIQPAA